MTILLSGLSIALVGLLVMHWWRPLPSIRVLAVLIALALLWIAQPLPGRALREVIGAPRTDRDTSWGGRPLGDYARGVLTMERVVLLRPRTQPS